ncbi:MAG: hypothetical protein ACK55Z_37675, partial [bacterium]
VHDARDDIGSCSGGLQNRLCRVIREVDVAGTANEHCSDAACAADVIHEDDVPGGATVKVDVFTSRCCSAFKDSAECDGIACGVKSGGSGIDDGVMYAQVGGCVSVTECDRRTLCVDPAKE